jgi:heme/copper-type cytochrome/quinol oxidase subunit 2
VTPDTAWVYAILPFLTMAVLTAGFVVVFRQRAKARRVVFAGAPAGGARPHRAWWASPVLWLAIVVAAVLLGSFVWPGFYVLAVAVVPLAWRRRPRRAPDVDPRSNGHAHRDGGAFTSP